MCHTHPVRIDIMFDICNYKDLFCQRTVTGSRLQHEVAKIWWMQSWRLLELATRLGATPLCMKPRLSLRPRSRASLMTFTVFKIENVAFCNLLHTLSSKKARPNCTGASWLTFESKSGRVASWPGRPWTSPMLSIRRWWTPCWKLSGKRPRSQWAAGGKPDFQGPQIWQLTSIFWWIDPVRRGTLKVVGVNTWESRWSLLDSGGGSRPCAVCILRSKSDEQDWRTKKQSKTCTKQRGNWYFARDLNCSVNSMLIL